MSKVIMLVPRKVKKEADPQTGEVPQPEDLTAFRNTFAWALLGEPGSGKSESLLMEAKALGDHAKFLRIDEFITDEPVEQWRGKTLFLDGLDEIRSGDNVMLRIRAQLRKLNNPPFRISCRAADWYGSTDRAVLEGAAQDGRLLVLFLEPLSHNDITEILRSNHSIANPDAFIENARQHNVDGLLNNPETLRLLATAVRENQWPATRNEIYELACEQLAQDPSKKHRDRQRNEAVSPNDILDAAGQLSAVLLLSGVSGIALDSGRIGARFIALSDCVPQNAQVASRALHSKLFRPEHEEERVVPSHRSIAEYLAARWLATQIDRYSLPVGRLLNLLLGRDGRTISGLRGLYAWLALHSHKSRSRLIEADPLTVIVYGDVKPMATADKRKLLIALRKEAEKFVGFRWGTQAAHSFGALADPALVPDFAEVLQAPDRSDAHQVHVDCVLDVLLHGEALPQLSLTVLGIVRDNTFHDDVRASALETWLSLFNDHVAAIELLDSVTNRTISDSEDRLTHALLQHLYPKYLPPEKLLCHLRLQRHHNLTIDYNWFWTYELPKCAPDDHLPILLDGFAKLGTALEDGGRAFGLRAAIDTLLARGIVIHGANISNERLFDWLGIGADKYGNINRKKDQQHVIADWLNVHPIRYKAVLSLCFDQCRQHERPRYCVHINALRLHNANAPNDLGVWHLSRALPEQGEEITKIHLSEAVNALAYQRGSKGLSLDMLFDWADTHPSQRHWLDSLLTWEIPDWRTEQTEREIERQNKLVRTKRERWQWLAPLLGAVRQGIGHPYVMHQLAGVWAERFIDTPGDTLAERFNNYSENGDDVLSAAEAGFKNCPMRNDLPGIVEIVDLSLKSREHYIRLPCLIGMDILWQQERGKLEGLADSVLGKIIAFHLTDGTRDASGWFNYLAQTKADLFAEVLVTYATKALKAKQGHVAGIYPLAHDPEYRKVAAIVAPRLLELFPLRAASSQLNNLEYLLNVAIECTPEVLSSLVRRKLKLKGMDAAQRAYWYMAAALLDPGKHETSLWRFVGKSKAKVNHLAKSLGMRSPSMNSVYPFTAQFISKMIEALAPDAEVEWRQGSGWVTYPMRRGDQVRALVTQLGATETSEADQELQRLIAIPSLRKIRRQLESARHELQSRLREAEFQFLSASKVAQIIANRAPANVADLAALALAHLDDIENAIRKDNDDYFRMFWNVKNKKKFSQREEELCRDAIHTRLKLQLSPLGIDVSPERDHANDKRADLSLNYLAQFELPIEVKKDSNPELWTALRAQLMAKYAIAPRAYGHGIYLVLWFGEGGIRTATDGGKKPSTAVELQARLTAMLNEEEQERIFVRVIDVSWPD